MRGTQFDHLTVSVAVAKRDRFCGNLSPRLLRTRVLRSSPAGLAISGRSFPPGPAALVSSSRSRTEN
jgi:hypothetical protein